MAKGMIFKFHNDLDTDQIIASQYLLLPNLATGIFPNTGLPLPFISYGVSSLVSLYIGIGVLLNVGLQQNKLEF